MRDIAVLIILITAIGFALRKPWYGVIGLALFDYLNPHTFAWGFARSIPCYQIILAVVFLTFFMSKKEDRQPIPRDWRIPTFYFLWLYMLFTTFFAQVPVAAWARLVEVSKIYLPLILTVKLINTRDKLLVLLATMSGGIGLIALKGGIWAVGTGFANRVWGPEGTQFGGNNEFAVVNLMMIPILLLIAREIGRPRIALAIRCAIPFCFAAAICSWSRGALLGSVVLVAGLLWHSKRKWLVAPLFAAGIIVLIGQLPDEWFGRMNTIQTYEDDASAMGRIETWISGWNFAIRHPVTGAGFDGYLAVTGLDWHNSFVEMFSEHGFIAFTAWCSLLFGTMLSLTRLIRLGKSRPGMGWVYNYATALRLSLAVYAVGTMFLGLSYWSVLYHLIFCAVLVKQFAEQEVASQVAQPASANRHERGYALAHP